MAVNNKQFKQITEVKLLNDSFEIKVNAETDPLKFNFIWLRENCRCTECYSQKLNQRHLTILDIPDDTKPIWWEINGNKLNILWNSTHRSEYSLEWLMEKYSPEILPQPIAWSGSVPRAVTIRRSELNNESKLCDLVRSLFIHGIGFVEDVEPTEKETEKVVTSLFPVQRTLFGDMWTFSDELNHHDSSYTNVFIGAHTDNTYFKDGAGLQVFHLLEHTGRGGETLLVDGFRAVGQVQDANPEYVDCLRSVSVESVFIEPDKNVSVFSPLLHYHPNGLLKQIRYNLIDIGPRMPTPSNNLGLFYRSLRCLASKITDPSGEWWLKLRPGTIALINNWRVLHGRAEYSGFRKMTGCYVAMGELLSRARILRVIR